MHPENMPSLQNMIVRNNGKVIHVRDMETKFDVLESRNMLAVRVSNGCIQQR